MKTTLCNFCCNVFFSSLIVHLKLSSVSMHSVKIFHITLLDPLSSHDSAVRMVSHWNWGRWFSLVIYQGFAGEAAHLWAPQVQHTLREMMTFPTVLFLLWLLYFGVVTTQDLTQNSAKCPVLFFLLVPGVKPITQGWRLVSLQRISNLYPPLPLSLPPGHTAFFLTPFASCICCTDGRFTGFPVVSRESIFIGRARWPPALLP